MFTFRKKGKQGQEDRVVNNIVIFTFTGIGLGTLWISAYAWETCSWTQFLNILGIASMLAGAFYSLGAFFGFLFGMPRTKPVAGKTEAANQATAGTSTNLEQISDWLTKILVGAGLTQINALPGLLKDFGEFTSTSLGAPPQSGVLAIGLLIYYVILGFFSGFLLTRLYLAGAIRAADLEKTLQQVESKISERDHQRAADDEALALVQRQLTAGPGTTLPTQPELDAVIKKASTEARRQIFYLARDQRSRNWETNKPRMERTIPVFLALIASEEPDKRYHNNYGQLGFALKDKEPPEYEKAVAQLTEAIKIRNAQKEAGWLYYEFARAICRIKLGEGRPMSDETRRQIGEDLRAAAQDSELKNKIKEVDPVTKTWLESNQAWLQGNNLALP